MTLTKPPLSQRSKPKTSRNAGDINMANWEKVVSVYDTTDKAKNALNVLKNSGIDTANVSLLDRNSIGSNVDQAHVGLWRRLFGENVWEHEAAVYGDTIKKGGAIL